jgi:hypothetical protein
LSAFLPLAFYGTVWFDPRFQASAIAPKAALGQPIRTWMHETHAGPFLLALLDLAGGRQASMARTDVPSTSALAGTAAAYGALYSLFMHWLAARTGVWVYFFLARQALCELAVHALLTLAGWRSLDRRGSAPRSGSPSVPPPRGR